MSSSMPFGVLLQSFFAEHLTNQKRVSPHTVKAYRDTLRLLLAHIQTPLRI